MWFSSGISTGIVSSIGTAASTGKGPLNEILALVFMGICTGTSMSTGIFKDNPTGSVSIISRSTGTVLFTGNNSSKPIFSF